MGTKEYRQEIAKGKNPSILMESPSTLLKEGAGKGVMRGYKERVDYGRVIGQHYDTKTGRYSDTTRAMIHYNTKGKAHIVPSEPRK